jgi:hypothetical protein
MYIGKVVANEIHPHHEQGNEREKRDRAKHLQRRVKEFLADPRKP